MIAAIVQARMTSTRLPEKVMKPLCGKPMLWHIITRLGYSKKLDKIIIATTDRKEDKIILKLAEDMGIYYYCGSPEDVLDRYYQAARKFNVSHIVRITADCPLIDPEVVDRITDHYLEHEYDYISNTIIPTYPDGLDTEVFAFAALEKTCKEAKLLSEREHVTAYIVKHPELFDLHNVAKDGKDLSWMRWTVDTPKDLEFVSNIFNELYSADKMFYMKDIIKLLTESPALLEINAGTSRNEGYRNSLLKDGRL